MVDYKTIVSATADKTTLLHWLKSLVAEFGQAKIADIAFSNDGNSTLTFTFTLEDGTKKTATCTAITLTSDEKKLITEMQKTVTASDDGVTFNQAVTFAGNVVFKGNEIHNGYASFLGDESHSGSELHKGESTFTDLKADSLTATDGQDLLSYDGANTAIKGKGTRPLYNDGEMALKSDLDIVNNAYLWLTSDITSEWFKSEALDGINLHIFHGEHITSYRGLFSHLGSESITSPRSIVIEGAPTNTVDGTHFAYFNIGLENVELPSTLKISNAFQFFAHCRQLKSITVFDTSECTNAASMFLSCFALKKIPAFDFSKLERLDYAFNECNSVTEILATGISVSADISSCKKMERDAIVTFLNNLADVTSKKTKPTLTLGTTLTDKLTTSDLLIATNKGWNLA